MLSLVFFINTFEDIEEILCRCLVDERIIMIIIMIITIIISSSVTTIEC